MVRDWGTCDGIAARVLRPLVERNPRTRAGLVRWRRSPNPWRRRCAAVAFVSEARRGRCAREVVTICTGLAAVPERFSQLGMGWLLREFSHADRSRVVAFLRRHHRRVNREALRYAIERMPRQLQLELLAEHRAARAKQKASTDESRPPLRRTT